MSLPKKLQTAYTALQNCQLLRTRTVDEKTLTEFQQLLNDCQPDLKTPDLLYQAQFDMVRCLYTANHQGFVKMISGSSAECLVLWTEAKVIVRHFDLHGVLYLSYSKDTGLYSAQKHERTATTKDKSTKVRLSKDRMIATTIRTTQCIVPSSGINVELDSLSFS
jgi:hypothetical protein